MTNINPAHYAEGFSNGTQVIDITENLTFNRGNAVKYLSRAGKKKKETEIEDLRKAEWYVKREIERVSKRHVPASAINWALSYQAYEAAYEDLDRADWELSLAEARTFYEQPTWQDTQRDPYRWYDKQPRVIAQPLDEHRDSWWRDAQGDRWRWYGYEDGHWQYFDRHDELWCDIQPRQHPSMRYAPFTEVPAV